MPLDDRDTRAPQWDGPARERTTHAQREAFELAVPTLGNTARLAVTSSAQTFRLVDLFGAGVRGRVVALRCPSRCYVVFHRGPKPDMAPSATTCGEDVPPDALTVLGRIGDEEYLTIICDAASANARLRLLTRGWP